MTDAEKREKVIRGLECHKAGFYEECLKCPYHDDGCETTLCNDAIALLNAQVPRVLGFLDLAETTTYWIEDHHEANQKTNCIPETVMDIMGDRVFAIPVVKLLNGYAPVISKNREGYRKTWRAWTARPTSEQMRDTPWEGEKDA